MTESSERTREIYLNTYVASLAVVAVALFSLCAWMLHPQRVSGRWVELLLFIGMICLCEIKPIVVARSNGIKEIVASTTFTFATFLIFGPIMAMSAQAGASILGDFFAKKPFVKVIFNIVQYWTAWGLAALVFVAIAGQDALGSVGSNWRWSAAVLTAGLSYFVINNGMVGVAIALSTGNRVLRVARDTIIQEAVSDCVLLALSPIVVIVADKSLFFLPLLLLPVLAVYRSASISAEKEHQALHDSLTDLPNRLSFEASLQRRLSQPRMGAHKAAVMLIDLDRFKEVNDTLGHQAGDALLGLIGPRIVQILPPDSAVARLGGDEFAVMLMQVPNQTEALAIAARIGEALDEPFRIDEFNLEVEASIGVALFPDHGQTSDVLIKRADIAMYVAKGRQSGVELYDSEQDHHSTRRLGLISELRKAIADGEIVLYYQPKLDLRTGRVSAVEALVRWVHPQLGVIPPSDFVPVAEHTGLIRPLTTFVLATAARQAAAWAALGDELSVAVNLSARSLHDGGIIHEVSSNLIRFDIPARLLRLEITESSIMADPVRARRILEQLHDMGVALSIDDFGTGYSSLSYLQDLPVNEIKIDQSFITKLVDNGADQVIVRSTIDLARNLGLSSTAEGVEDDAALVWLREAGCDHAQGYQIARPMTAEALGVWLVHHNEALAAAERARVAPSLKLVTRQDGTQVL